MNIIQEFNFLQQRYNLPDVECFSFHDARQSVKLFRDNPNCKGLFLHQTNSILMRDRRVYQLNLQVLLHEIGHAIQHREGRLTVPKHHKKKQYALELEAEIFALTEYRKLYGDDFGKMNLNWHLGSYDMYFEGKPDTNYLDRLKSIYSFVRNLRGKEKKPILKMLNRREDECVHWEYLLKKVEV